MLRQTLERISYACKIKKISSVYETFPKISPQGPAFLNCCVLIETDMSADQLLQFLIETERQVLGSHDEFTTRNRVIDCDLIDFDGQILRTPKLTLPHPDAHRRTFVLVPLAEILPDWVHPVVQKTANELAIECQWPGWGAFFSPGQALLDF
jgi:2-amino-4-hydroxy-6-hydroxymethyldihydropteridine diphosphokinase